MIYYAVYKTDSNCFVCLVDDNDTSFRPLPYDKIVKILGKNIYEVCENVWGHCNLNADEALKNEGYAKDGKAKNILDYMRDRGTLDDEDDDDIEEDSDSYLE